MKNSFTLSGLYNSKSLLTTFLSLLAGCLYLKGKRIKTVSYSDDLAITRNIQAQYIASSIIPLTAKIMISNHIVELRAFVTRKEKKVEGERIARCTTGVRRVINYF